jgi:hypothetical protein
MISWPEAKELAEAARRLSQRLRHDIRWKRLEGLTDAQLVQVAMARPDNDFKSYVEQLRLLLAEVKKPARRAHLWPSKAHRLFGRKYLETAIQS